MNITETAETILRNLEQYADPLRKEMVAINHPTSMKVIGLKVPNQRKVIEEWRKKLSHYDEKQWVELCLELACLDILECQQVAFELIWKNKKVLQKLTFNEILALGKTLDNWVSVDMYCLCITGFGWRTGIIKDSVIEDWAKSENRWIRRTALVSTIPLNLKARGGKGDVSRTLKICALLAGDSDDMIVKAMSWALRELSKTDKQSVIDFMNEFDSLLHSKVKREVKTKLVTGKKNGVTNKLD